MKKVLLVVFMLIVILVLGRAYWAYEKATTSGFRSSSSAIVATPETVPVKPEAAPVVALLPTDCGSDYQCFIKAAGTCSKATMIQTQALALLGYQVTSKIAYSIEGTNQAGLCVSSSNLLDVKFDLAGMTDQQKLAVSQSANYQSMQKSAAKEVGKVVRCTRTNASLEDAYTKLSKGIVDASLSDSCASFDALGNPWVAQ